MITHYLHNFVLMSYQPVIFSYPQKMLLLFQRLAFNYLVSLLRAHVHDFPEQIPQTFPLTQIVTGWGTQFDMSVILSTY